MSDLLDLSPPPADHRVAYGKHPLQFGDLFLPEERAGGRLPLVLALHGGFWRGEHDLLHLGHLCRAIAERGIAVYSVEYRRLGHEGGGIPGTLLDVARAAEFLPELAARFPVDLRRVVALGHSAGGQLALWLAGRHNAPTGWPLAGAPPELAGVVALAPVSDLVEAALLGLGNDVVLDFAGGTPEEHPDAYAAASPRALLPLGLRQILVHGTLDDTVPHALSRAYVREAKAHGDEARLESLEGLGHFEPIDPRSAAFPVVLRALQELLRLG
jgi:acetyl esterase/lipase